MMFRRLRAALMVGATWALAWFPIGCILALLVWRVEIPSRELAAIVLGIWTALGGMSGTLFALLLTRYERGQSVDTLRPSRLALLGTAAGAGIPVLICLPLLWLDVRPSVVLFILTGALGACCAWATIALARRGRAVADTVGA